MWPRPEGYFIISNYIIIIIITIIIIIMIIIRKGVGRDARVELGHWNGSGSARRVVWADMDN